MKHLILLMIRWYRRSISPKTISACRFSPTCSAYACEAIEKYGVLRGGWLAARRILRCNPLCKDGWDPVP
ncbi:MAG: membrane protein insertion efficiency factor YidD [Oscillospiraceae bacterium]|nr:membrane protein insertion efficiency factor YidD [Oscillospiraceae bacterium]